MFGLHRHERIGIRAIIWDVILKPFPTPIIFGEKCIKWYEKTLKIEALRRAFSLIFLVFCRKWQTAFGLRLCSRIRGRAPRFHSLVFPWCPWIFQCFFDVYWGFPGASFHRSAAGAAPPYLTSRTTLLFTCTSCPRWWPSTCSLVGSSLEPAAGSTSPSASTQPREVGV